MKYTGPLYAKIPGTRKYVKLREDSEYVDNLETKLAEARAEIERKNRLIERMKNCQNCGRTGGFCRHCRYALDKRGSDNNWKEPI